MTHTFFVSLLFTCHFLTFSSKPHHACIKLCVMHYLEGRESPLASRSAIASVVGACRISFLTMADLIKNSRVLGGRIEMRLLHT